MPRLFTALDVPASAHERIQSLTTDTLEARWTPPEKYHVTLRFIGEVSEERAETIADALREVQAAPVTLRPRGLTAFPSRRKPRVLVVSFEKTPALSSLYHTVEEALGAVGVDPEDRHYHPHLTFARLKQARPEDVHAYLRAQDSFEIDPLPVEQFHLYESILRPEGALHQKRLSVDLSEENS